MTSAENSGGENNTYVAPLPAPNSLVAEPANAQTGAYSPNAMHPIKPAKVKRAPRHAPSPYEPAPSPLYNAAYPAAFAYSATPSAPYASQSNPDLRAPRNSAYPAYSIYSAPLTSGPMAAVPTKAKKLIFDQRYPTQLLAFLSLCRPPTPVRGSLFAVMTGTKAMVTLPLCATLSVIHGGSP